MPGVRRWPAWLIAAVVLSLAARLFAWWIAGTRVPVGDPFNYAEIARNLLSGRGMVIDDPMLIANLRAFYPPGYPLLLAAIGLAVPLTATSLVILNTAIDALAAALLARIGARLGDARAGRVAGALYFLWPASVLLSPLAYKEALAALLVVIQIAALLAATRGSRPATAAFGIAAGLAVLVQPGWAPLSVLMALALLPEFPNWRMWLKQTSAAAAIAGLVLAPWWLRNALEFGRFVPFTTAGGAGLWVGATLLGDGSWVQAPARFLRGDEVTMSAAMGAEARQIIAADPLRYLVHCLGKIVRTLSDSAGPIRQLYWMEPARHYALLDSLRVFPLLATMGLMVVSAIAAILRVRGAVLRLVIAGLAQVLLFGMWFEFTERHRHFLTPLLLLLACVGAFEWVRMRRSQSAG